FNLFSGSTQGVSDNNIPNNAGQPTTANPFTTPNLAAELRRAGISFGAYGQSLPFIGSQAEVAGSYYRKHFPTVNWQDNAWLDDTSPISAHSANTLPVSVSMPFTSFPADYSTLPAVSLVVPDHQNNSHDGTIQQMDSW